MPVFQPGTVLIIDRTALTHTEIEQFNMPIVSAVKYSQQHVVHVYQKRKIELLFDAARFAQMSVKGKAILTRLTGFLKWQSNAVD